MAPPQDVAARPLRRRRRRRRRLDKPPANARLVLDDHVRGDVGILSEDLFADLFPHLYQQEQQQKDGANGFGAALARATPSSTAATSSIAELDVYHVAMAPWTPNATAESTDWTIVPVAKSSALAPSTVQFSPSSLALQNFAAILQQVAPSKFSGHSRRGIEVLLLDVEAVALDTVFVSLEGDLSKRLEAGEGTFFREHPTASALQAAKNKAKGANGEQASAEDRLTTALRVALGTLQVVHSGDLFPLPLPPHPITHVPPNPGKVTFCEPVAQGVLSPSTRIIVSRGKLHSKTGRNRGADLAPIPPSRKLNGVSEDEGDDTANDQFYSAAEERTRGETETDAPTEDSEVTESEADLSPVDHDDDLEDDDGGEISDDSMDEMISLQAPTLPATLASGVSTLQPGSPMTIGRGRRTNGVATPGSVFSSFTATTARPDRPRGRLFKAQGLTAPIPPEILHPKPGADDDDEARVYVDVNNLTRIGCFSGDWVRLEEAEEPPANGFGRFALGSFGEPAGDEPDWRPVRVFGLPEGYSQRPVTRIPSAKHDNDGRRLSFFESQIQRPSSPIAYLSPVLLANMQSTPYLRLSPLRAPQHPPSSSLARHGAHGRSSKMGAASQPPFAQKVIIQQVRTPVPIEKSVQTAVVAGLKWHFEKKLRVVKTGDYIAIPIDAQLGRTMNDMLLSNESAAVTDILSLTGGIKEPSSTTNGTSGSNNHAVSSSAQAPSAGANASGKPSLKADEVAWFKVTHVQPQPQPQPQQRHYLGDDEQEEESVWGTTVACVDISTAHLEQSGTTTSRIPGTKDSNWPYYLGLREPPRRYGDRAAPAVVEPDRKQVSPLRRQLRDLVAAATSKRAIYLKMPPVAILLVSTQRHIGKASVAVNACSDMGLHTFTVDAYDIVNEAGAGGGDAKTEGVLKGRAGLAMSCGPECCALLIRHIEALTADRMVSSMKEVLEDARVLIATTTEADKIPDGVRSLFTHEMEMHAPDETERQSILRNIVNDRALVLDPEVDLASVALKTAALVAGDLVDVVERALVCRQSRLEKLVIDQSTPLPNASDPTDVGLDPEQQLNSKVLTLRDVQVAGGAAVRGLTKADFDAAVDAARKNFADAIGAPKIPNVTWNDVGGLDNVKDVVMETIQLPLERPELFAKGMKKRSGILFYGPPGTGKTLLAKAIATEYSLNFFSVKGPELLNMYIGESEANVRRVFQRARDARPCVVFFDELDSVAPKRGNQGDSGGVMDRIVSQLLAELDGMSGGGDDDGDGPGAGSGGVFVIGATNRPDLLDQALLRPGRFDTMLYLGVSDTHDKQLRILEALTRKFTLHPSVSLRSIAQKLPFTYTGADFYALCSDAMLKAVTRQASAVDAKIAAMTSSGKKPMSTAYYFDHYATPEDVAVLVTEEDFLEANRELVPSISAGELAHYERVRATFEGKKKEEKEKEQQQRQQAQIAPAPAPAASSGSASHSARHAARKNKGKGKASSLRFSDVEEEDEESANGNDADNNVSDDDTGSVILNGRAKGKGKAPAAVPPGFEEQRASDDEDLYN
ncbi:peroxisomal assembly protein [Sporothrix eucalyptigena]